jgi:hypothetical protein
MKKIVCLIVLLLPQLVFAQYSDEDVSYFQEIAFGSEYGSKEKVVKKWTTPMRIKVFGSPTTEDMATLKEVISELNALIHGTHIEITQGQYNMAVHFAPEEEFKTILPSYIPTNYGFFWVWYNRYEFNKGVMLITTTHISQKERNHIIREETTQSLGLMNDSLRYDDSIFQSQWTDVTEFSPIDRRLIQMLYDPRIKPGMRIEEATRILKPDSPPFVQSHTDKASAQGRGGSR